jgi:hypothetical protein
MNSALYFRIGEREQEELGNTADIQRLPCLASQYWANEIEAFGWTPTLREIMVAVKDNASPFALLEGHEATLVRNIYSFLSCEFAKHVKLTIPAAQVGNLYGGAIIKITTPRSFRGEFDSFVNIDPEDSRDCVAFTTCGDVTFPPSRNINVNMMPFIYGDMSSLPAELRAYESLIDMCPINESEKGKVCYLTVHESFVDPDNAQRRQGLHIEAPGTVIEEAPGFTPAHEHQWGCGVFFSEDEYDGGIYMASSVGSTSRVFDALVDHRIPGIVDVHGGCEHLRRILGHKGATLNANELIWMTDRTPHEALPQETAGERQYFRLVTSQVSHWFAKHSTPNPKVPLPDDVIVVDESKFY